jgi:predicted sugar kinase
MKKVVDITEIIKNKAFMKKMEKEEAFKSIMAVDTIQFRGIVYLLLIEIMAQNGIMKELIYDLETLANLVAPNELVNLKGRWLKNVEEPLTTEERDELLKLMTSDDFILEQFYKD